MLVILTLAPMNVDVLIRAGAALEVVLHCRNRKRHRVEDGPLNDLRQSDLLQKREAIFGQEFTRIKTRAAVAA